MKKILAMILSLLIVLSFSACARSQNINGMTAEKAIQTALENAQEVKSVRMDGTMNMAFSAMNISMNVDMSYLVEMIKDPEAMHLKISMDMGSLGSQETESYIIAEADEYICYVNTDGSWTKQISSTPQGLENINNISADLQTVSKYEVVGEETINGEKTTHYVGKVDKEKFADVLENSGVMSMVGDLGLSIDEEALSEVIAQGAAQIILDVWVSQETVLPIRYSMDLTEVMKTIFETVSEQLGMEITVSQMKGVFDFTDYNAVRPITVPEVAVNPTEG